MEVVLIITLVILAVFLWFWAIVDITRSRFKKPSMNTVWLLAVLFFPIIGPIFYFQFRKESLTKERRKFQPNFKREQLEAIE